MAFKEEYLALDYAKIASFAIAFLLALASISFAVDYDFAHYIQHDENGTANGCIWNNATGNYYGYYNGTSAHNSTCGYVFPLCDEFEAGGAINSSMWITTGAPTQSAGRLYIISDAVIESKRLFPIGYSTEGLALVNTSPTGSNRPIGFFNNTDAYQQVFILASALSLTDYYGRTYNGAITTTTTATATTTAWTKLRVERVNSAQSSYYIDNTLKLSIALTNPTKDLPASSGSGGAAKDFWLDYLMVKNATAGTVATTTGPQEYGVWAVNGDTFYNRRWIISNASYNNQNCLSYSDFNSTKLAFTTTNVTYSPYVETVSVTLNAPADALTTLNHTIAFNYTVNSTNATTDHTAILYFDGIAINQTNFTTNTTLQFSYDTTYGNHSWYVFAYKYGNISINATSATRTFSVYYAVSALSPSNAATLSSTNVTFSYQTTNLYPILCNLTLNGTIIHSQTQPTSINYSINSAIGVGAYTWFVNCTSLDSAYFINTTSRTLTIGTSVLNTTINLTSSPENVFSSPQGLFYDISGNLNVIYFTDEGTYNTVRIKTIAGGAVTASYNATLTRPKPFLIAFRENGKTSLLTYNTNGTTMQFTNFTGSTISVDNLSTASNVTSNSYFDAYTYAYTKQYPTLSYTANSYYLFQLPGTPEGTKLIRKNISTETLTILNTTNHNRTVAFQSIANSSDLTTWYYAFPKQYDATQDYIAIYAYNGTHQTEIAVPDSNYYTQTQFERAIVAFEQYDGNTYAIVTNATTKAVIWLINEQTNATINEQVSNPSHFFFIDKNTFVFFSQETGGTISAFSCYFGAGTGNCAKFSQSDYGIYVPYDRGTMVTAKRSGSEDYVVKGVITSGSVVQFNYNENIYDAKFICYDEQDEFRKTFTMRIYSDNSSIVFKNTTWGYVIPSVLAGAGTKKAYSLCQNGTTRLFFVGLTGNYSLDYYSLNTTEGTYYTFVVKNQYGAILPNARVSAYRFSNEKQAFVIIEQGISDYSGTVTFFLETFNPYRITVEDSGYVVITFDFTPTLITSAEVRLEQENNATLTLPDFSYIWSDVSYHIAPPEALYINGTNISFQVSSSSAKLQSFGMNITRTYNGTTTNVHFQNVTTQPSGSTLTYEATSVGTYNVYAWIKHENYTIYYPPTHRIMVGNATGLLKVREEFTAGNIVSGWGYYFFALVVAMVCAGFVANYTIDGAGVMGLLILWGFSIFYPGACVVTLFSGICLTPIAITSITTVMVGAGLYLKNVYL